jgi:hypothetical protein
MTRLRRAIIVFSLAALALAGVDAVSPAFSQTPPPPVTLKVENKTGVFELDLADLNVTPELKNAIKNASWSKCYPPRATFKVVVKRGGDTLFLKTLAGARAEALVAALPSLGLAAGEFKTEIAPGDSDYVQVSYGGPFKPDPDTDAPKLKVTSTPPKGTKIKAGDKIKVTITASELYEDGHKSWPTGVQLIQLTADDGLVNSQDYGRVPPPCDRRTWEATYTVPKHPPPIVRLLGIAADGVGHQDSEELTFPTEDGVFPYHVVVEGSVQTQFAKDTKPETRTKARLNWHADYPNVYVRVTQYQQTVAFKPVKGTGQGTIVVEFMGEIHGGYYSKECAITMRLPHLAADVYVDGASGFQRRDRWDFYFSSSLTEAGGQALSAAQTSAERAACTRLPGAGFDFGKAFHIGSFGFPTNYDPPGPKDQFTTADGLIWNKPNLGNLDLRIGSSGEPPPLGFPLNLLKEGKPFTMSTGKRVEDRRGDYGVEHNEGMITVTFSRP